MKEFKTVNGLIIPPIGFGTWKLKDKEDLARMIPYSIKKGIKHIDTATLYENEKDIGDILKTLGVPREDLFITTKIPGEMKGKFITKWCFKKSLKNLQVEYIDLYLIHRPHPRKKPNMDCRKKNIATFKTMMKLYNDGLIRVIGVSNFTIPDLKNIYEGCGVYPMVNQIPVHIGRIDHELIAFCHENNIIVEGYSPFGRGEILKDKTINEIALKYKVSPSRICMKYVLQHGCLPLFKTTHEEYFDKNISLDFEINKEDMLILDNTKPK